jgi:hypothetical protein
LSLPPVLCWLLNNLRIAKQLKAALEVEISPDDCDYKMIASTERPPIIFSNA